MLSKERKTQNDIKGKKKKNYQNCFNSIKEKYVAKQIQTLLLTN